MAEAADEEIGDRAGVPRPRETATLIGHGAAEAAFAEGIAAGRLHHAWLIGGPQGIGKATLAYRVARRLLAYPQGGGPAGLSIPGNHPVHGQVAGLSHPNLVALRRHKALGAKTLPTKISVDMVRKALDLFASTAADSGWRICVLDSAEDLNANAANALLKVLEEPPPRALFLILAHQPGRLLPTIRSRCRAMILRPLADGEVADAIRALPPPFAQPDDEMAGQLERDLAVFRPAGAVLDIAGERALAAVRVDGGDAVAHLQQGDGDMHRRRCLARPALLVAEDDHMRVSRCGRRFSRHQPRFRTGKRIPRSFKPLCTKRRRRSSTRERDA